MAKSTIPEKKPTSTPAMVKARATSSSALPKAKVVTGIPTKKTSTVRKSPAAKKMDPIVVQETSPAVAAPQLKKQQLIEDVVERSGIKKKFAKPAIEAALAVLGEALADGRELNLRPLGKVKVQRTKTLSNGTVMVVRVRQPLAQEDRPVQDVVADAAE